VEQFIGLGRRFKNGSYYRYSMTPSEQEGLHRKR
jgi:hypothetical protein